MPITLNGSGTISGISAGGLPDGVITTDDIAANAVTTAKLGANEQSGLAKAWVNYNGVTQTIRASYNVSSVTYNGTADFTVNFTNPLADTNYVAVGISGDREGGRAQMVCPGPSSGGGAPTTTSMRFNAWTWNASLNNGTHFTVAFFR